MVSREFIAAVKLSEIPAYRLAQRAGIDPVTLSKLMNGIVRPKVNDARIIAVGHLLGLKPSECFTGQEDERCPVG
jgi:transcriptional regulator with XRE-family HTH domain